MKIALLGDIGLLGVFTLKQNPNLLSNLQIISDYLNKFDYVVGNLETPFSIKRKPWGAKSAFICSGPENIAVLKALHIDAVTIANNHMYDFGHEGFSKTIEVLESAGINWFGANGKSLLIEKDDNKILFQGYCCYSSNPLKIVFGNKGEGVNGFNLNQAKDELIKSTQNGYISILAIHSGIEHVNRPSIDQIEASRQLANIAPYVWYGHHPHVVQGIDNYKKSIIAHSLGNFCFDGNKEDRNRPTIELTDNNRKGMILEIEICNNKIIGYESTIIKIGETGTIELEDHNNCVSEFSNYISQAIDNPAEYNNARVEQRSQYIKKRKELRNLKWVLKRLRYRYFKLFIGNKINAKKYRQNLLKYLVAL